MRVVDVVGTCSDLVKLAPVIRKMQGHPQIVSILVQTGPHDDRGGSEQFLMDPEIKPLDFGLGVGPGSHAVQTAEVMRRLEPILDSIRPDLVLVVGDVNSTPAAAITAVRLGISVAHVEAGLRSCDRTMPEEINRLLADAVADLFFVTEEGGRENLLREGVAAEKIHFVGNLVVDALQAFRSRWEAASIFGRLQLDADHPYAVVTFDRPAGVDAPLDVMNLLDALHEVGRHLPVVVPLHPRVKQQLLRQGYMVRTVADSGQPVPPKGIAFLDPLGYLDVIALMSRARLVLTDSGGIQDETTVLGVPCLTLRNTTERRVTVTHGTNRVIGSDPARIMDEVLRTLDQPPQRKSPPPLWDGRAAERIVRILADRQGRQHAA